MSNATRTTKKLACIGTGETGNGYCRPTQKLLETVRNAGRRLKHYATKQDAVILSGNTASNQQVFEIVSGHLRERAHSVHHERTCLLNDSLVNFHKQGLIMQEVNRLLQQYDMVVVICGTNMGNCFPMFYWDQLRLRDIPEPLRSLVTDRAPGQPVVLELGHSTGIEILS
jgi:hypothetical protein